MITEQSTKTTSFVLGDLISPAVTQMVENVNPSVVQVRAGGRGGGAGFVWRADGKILTNAHVVGNARTVQAQLPDGRTFEAAVVASNPTLDLALLTVDASDLPAVPIGDSSGLRVGELVIAIGHPWGQPGVVTAGIVSGIGEIPVNGSGRTAQYIRSDVRLAPGNSGGPMLNARGEVIGINAMIFGGDLAVAIPSHVANKWLAGQASGRVITLGVQVQPVELRQSPGDRRSAALLIVGIGADTLAARAGLMVGDVLLDVNGTLADDPYTLRDALAAHAEAGLKLRVLRGGIVQQVEVDVGVAERVL